MVKLSLDGNVLAVASAADVDLPAVGFDGLAIDYYGSVFATDSANGRIHKLDRNLRHVTSIGSPGTGDMELDEPRGITLWRRFGQIFITEREGAQYFWIGTDILDLQASPDRIAPGGDELRLRYYLTEVARVTVELVDSGGSVVHTVVSNRRRATGENIEHWDGMLGRNSGPAPAGEYVLRVTATPTYSSGEYFNDTAETGLVVTEPTSH